MNKHIVLILLALLLTVGTQAQRLRVGEHSSGMKRISREYNNVSISDALNGLAEQQTDYAIMFLYNELEDFRITTTISRKTLPDAIQQMIGFYPIRMIVDESNPDGKKIFVECTHKTDRHLTGTIIDEQGQPVAYANIAVLNPTDSTLLGGGVSNESGYFAIPYEQEKVLARISYVGYKTVYRICEHPEVGAIRLQPDNYTLKGVKVTGYRRIIKSQTDRLQYMVSADEFAKGLTANELMRRVPLLQTSEDAVNIIGKGTTHFLLNGRELPDDMVQAKLRSLKSEDIERIEVITIPPSKYKAEANAGYVNIVTKRDQTLGLRGDIADGLHLKEHVNWDAMPSVNYATKRLDVSFAASANSMKGSNDRTHITTFEDHEKRSDFVRCFNWKVYNANLLAKYQLSPSADVGLLSNVSTNRMDVNQHDVTSEWESVIVTDMTSPKSDNFNLSAEFFIDWKMDDKGKMMTLTYDYLNNYAQQDERLTSNLQDMQTTGSSRYRIDAWKMDFALPCSFANLETGLHYTHIGNNSNLNISNDVSETWAEGMNQKSEFLYTEQTAAAYVSGWRQVGKTLSVKAGLRLEKTWIEGRQVTGHVTNRDHYLYVFPTAHVNWSPSDKAHIGAAYSKGIYRPEFMYLNPFRFYTTPTNYFAGNPFLIPGLTDNVEINFSNGRGLYAVLYESHQKDALSTPTAFTSDGVQSMTVDNCLSTDKMGLYVSWQRNLFKWWNLSIGGEAFYAQSIVTLEDTNLRNLYSWSGKVEFGSDWFLNRQHTLVLHADYTHVFPHVSLIAEYKSVAYLYAQLRYSLLDNRLRLSLSVSDPFRQNISRSTSRYNGYSVYLSNYVHPHSVTLSASWSFGGDKVRRSYRQSKNTEASRAGK